MEVISLFLLGPLVKGGGQIMDAMKALEEGIVRSIHHHNTPIPFIVLPLPSRPLHFLTDVLSKPFYPGHIINL